MFLMKNGPYEMVVAPEGYPGKRYRGRYAYEHHVVWWQETGEVVPEGFIIHHRNEQKRDNRFANLELMSNAEHTSQHGSERGRQMVVLQCPTCSVEFERERRLTHLCEAKGSLATYCSRSCAGKAPKYGAVDQVIREYVQYPE